MTRSRLSSAFFFAAVVLSAGIVRANATFGNVDLYQSFDEMVEWAEGFEADNSDIVKIVEFGRSSQDRPLLAIRISTTPGVNNSSKPEFLFTGGLHAREVITSEASYRLAEYLADGYRAGNGAVLDILAEREVWIVPNLNPDGRVRVEGDVEGDSYNHSQQRKNMQLFTGQNQNNYQRGVDLNRNFPYMWEKASNSISSETYRGPEALSTPEANAFWHGLLKNQDYFSDIRAAIDFHSGAKTVLTPWIASSGNIPPADRDTFLRLAGEMSTKGDGTIVGINTLGYDAYGTLTDSLYASFYEAPEDSSEEQKKIYAFCEELYEGPWYYPYTDFFKLFNPLNQTGIDSIVDHAIESAMFLLSDEAFYMTPEPSVLAMMLVLAGIFVLLARRP